MKRLFLFSLFFLSGIFLFSGVVFASYGLTETAGAANLIQYGPSVPKLIGNVVGTALSLVSVVFFILAVYGGFRMMLARGKEEEFTKGRDVLIHATIGLIIILASYAITRLVFRSVKGGAGTTNQTEVVQDEKDKKEDPVSEGDWCQSNVTPTECLKYGVLSCKNQEKTSYKTDQECIQGIAASANAPGGSSGGVSELKPWCQNNANPIVCEFQGQAICDDLEKTAYLTEQECQAALPAIVVAPPKAGEKSCFKQTSAGVSCVKPKKGACPASSWNASTAKKCSEFGDTCLPKTTATKVQAVDCLKAGKPVGECIAICSNGPNK